MLRIGVIGLGDISKIHVPVITEHPEAELIAVSDIDEEAYSSLPDIPCYPDYRTMLQEEKLDCVHICLPHHLHYPATKVAVERGIHVILEKPLAHTLSDSQAIVDLEAANPHVKIAVNLQNRLNETVECLQELVQSGTYGDLLSVKGLVAWHRPKSYYEVKPWRASMETAGGGVMINQSIHTLDLLQWFGGGINTIRGSIDTLLDYGYDVEDTASAYITFESGATGLFFATNANGDNSSVELQLILEKAKFTIKDSILTITQVDEEKKILAEDRKLPGSKFYYGASHAKLINHFYRQIEQDGDDYIHAKDAYSSMEMIALINESSRTKQTLSRKVSTNK
ncbi:MULTISPECIES: Gfo/Idh/MocA family protein [Gracilibacillus]|uniref:Gfo/Idh/MocA family protein n=1 Tax=Gracilibacillus TaxID=74385 RepID=UPI0008249975|nr:MULTISPECIES: Gfo/Idh/MocA family oxidoreductase [Gracilibacillus]